jgi:hypothetical protein
MENHQRLSIAIATSDLLYVAGSLLRANGDHQSWPFAQWGTTVAYEARKHLRDVHSVEIELDWEDQFAESARHGSKYYDGKAGKLDKAVADFERTVDSFEKLAAATHESFFPADRRGGTLFDFLRDDLSVIADESELVLTNVTGHFMVGLPPERAARLESIGDHVKTLTTGLGQFAAGLTRQGIEEIREHGSRVTTALTCWDAKMYEAIPSTFGGTLSTGLAFSLISIASSAQAARRWAKAECCGSCSAAALKHRFVLAHHTAKSMVAFSDRARGMDSDARQRAVEIAHTSDAEIICSEPFRNLRNGWLHLGLSDIPTELDPADLLGVVTGYTGLSVDDFSRLVDAYLFEVTLSLNEWLLRPGHDGRTFFDHVHAAPPDKADM